MIKLNKKFSIKDLVAVGAVAMAMIGISGATGSNVNVHADSYNAVLARGIAASNKEDAQADKAEDQGYKEQNHQNAPLREAQALEDISGKGGFLDPNLGNDPDVRPYLHKKGYSNHAINNAEKQWNSQYKNPYGLTDYGYEESAKEAQEGIADPIHYKGHYITSHTHYNIDALAKGKGSHVRKHLTKSTVRGVESTVAKDERAIKRDEKKLNTKSGREFSKNMSYYKDLQARKASLRRVVRSHHASKSAKRHARKVLRSLNKKAPRQKKMAKKARKMNRK